MSPILEAAAVGLIRTAVTEYVAWQTRRAQAADWKPSPQDVDDFLAEIAADTPEALKAKVAASLGLQWPPPPTNPT